MSDESIKVSHGLVHLIRPSGESDWPWFPYSTFVDFEKREVAAGRPPLRLTATYGGRSRPVYFNWSLGGPETGERPSVQDPRAWEQAIHVSDDRYITWLLENYVKPVMLHKYFSEDGRAVDVDAPYPNEWLGMDEIALNYHLYGVLDDAGKWVPMDSGPVMNRPFPDGSHALHAMYRRFFARLHELSPELRIMANAGSPDDWAAFVPDFADVDGLLVEDLFGSKDRMGADRARLANLWRAVAAFARNGGVVLVKMSIDPASSTYDVDLRTGLMGYLMLSGVNTAWAPQIPGYRELAPATYESMKAALGHATSALGTRRDEASGGALFTRTTQNGVAFVNGTGHEVWVECPSGGTCRDRSGNVVDGMVVPDLTGDYLLTSG